MSLGHDRRPHQRDDAKQAAECGNNVDHGAQKAEARRPKKNDCKYRTANSENEEHHGAECDRLGLLHGGLIRYARRSGVRPLRILSRVADDLDRRSHQAVTGNCHPCLSQIREAPCVHGREAPCAHVAMQVHGEARWHASHAECTLCHRRSRQPSGHHPRNVRARSPWHPRHARTWHSHQPRRARAHRPRRRAGQRGEGGPLRRPAKAPRLHLWTTGTRKARQTHAGRRPRWHAAHRLAHRLGHAEHGHAARRWRRRLEPMWHRRWRCPRPSRRPTGRRRHHHHHGAAGAGRASMRVRGRRRCREGGHP
mmetsp:Transcript_112185/g.362323  ORF Transcript_112185/g.362323 Transcript_112185/m.362323 type:complete len:309 (-) Transcript_112185:7-933(-)